MRYLVSKHFRKYILSDRKRGEKQNKYDKGKITEVRDRTRSFFYHRHGYI